jgi:DNA topoisomerase-1
VPLGVPCPKCGSHLSARRSRRGKTFYGCTAYPKCDFVSWDKPRAERCPLCDNAWLVEKFSKRDGALVACPNKECGYRKVQGGEPAPQAPESPTGT